MSLIFDTSDNPITSFSISLESAEVKTFTIKIDCKTSNFLSSEVVGDLTVEAKLHTDSGWTNIETTPLDLSAYNATRPSFDVRLTAGTVSSPVKRIFNLTVGP